MIAIVVSRADRASEHVGERLLELADWTERDDPDRPDADGGGTYYRADGFELRTFEEMHVELADPAPVFDDPDLVVFVSRHSGETGPLLTAHFTGNFGPAEYGGEPGELARTAPNAQAALVESFAAYAPEGYDVGIEGTHHGPSEVSVPSLFAELGSADEQWDDPAGARAVARAVLDLDGVAADRESAASAAGGPGDGETPNDDRGSNRHLVGFGGGHYAPRYLRLLRETPWAIGHVAVDWQLSAMGDPAENRDAIERAFERSAAELAVIDSDRPDLAATIEALGRRVVSETWAREVGDRPLGLVEALETAVAPVDDGLRFGEREPATDGSGEKRSSSGGRNPASSGVREAFDVVDLPTELLAEAQGIDAEAARAAVERRTVAFETEQNGARATGRAAVRDPTDRDALVDDLADVLTTAYDAVERTTDGEGEAVLARETAFDPGKAATLGVPEGPAFGRLANGEAVTVDGERIDPAAVSEERTRRFPV